MAAELAVHKNTPQILVSNNEDSLYFHNNPNLSSSYTKNTVAGTEITDEFDVLNWFQIQQMKFSTLTRFTYIIHSITPLQTENKRYFSLGGIYTVSLRFNLSVEMLSDFIFINRNSTELGRNTTIDVFGGSVDAVDGIVDDMESNPYAFADSIDTE